MVIEKQSKHQSARKKQDNTSCRSVLSTKLTIIERKRPKSAHKQAWLCSNKIISGHKNYDILKTFPNH
jgi:hypothetical protein